MVEATGIFYQSKGCCSDLQQMSIWPITSRVGGYLQVGPLDPPNAPGRVPPGLLGSEDQLILGQLVGSCCFDLLGHCFQSGQVFFYFWPFEQETGMKRNNEHFSTWN